MINNLLSKIRIDVALDPLVVISLVVLPILAYIAFTIIQFAKTDKSAKSLHQDVSSKGLSRFCVAGIFVLFGLILVGLAVEFFIAYLVQCYETIDSDSKLISSMVAKYRGLPLEMLINGSIFCIALYTGTEGLIASLKTLNVSAGLSIELPYIKRKRLSAMFIVWSFLSILGTVYHIFVGSEEVDFCVVNLYVGLVVDLAILFLAERAPTMLENSTNSKIANGIIKVANTVISEAESGPAMDVKQEEAPSVELSAAVDEK